MTTFNNIFKISHNNVLPDQGSILISEPFLQDAYFQRSVILLVEHTADGSMGFVLNKKTDLAVNTFFPELESYPPIPIYLGGPVSPNRLFFIHSLGNQIIPDSVRVNDNLYFGGSFDSLKTHILNGHSIEGKAKFFLGYSGWSEGQLGKEISGDSWIVSRAASESIIHADGEIYWKKTLKPLGIKYRTWINYPKNPDLN